jgi:hypothetical protein
MTRAPLPAAIVAIALLGSVSSASADSAEHGWKHQYVSNDGNVLTYSEDGKVIFYMACGRGFAISVKYPGKAKKEGDAEIAIATSKGHMAFKGQFEEPIEVSDPVPMNFATTFHQAYLGYIHSDTRVFGKEWNAKKARVLDMLDAHGPITISAGKNSYQLPAIDVTSDWHKAIDECKF